MRYSTIHTHVIIICTQKRHFGLVLAFFKLFVVCNVIDRYILFANFLHNVHHLLYRPCHTRLNAEFWSDLAWWMTFVTMWNGMTFHLPPAHLQVLEMSSNASVSWGCWAWHQLTWFQVCWDARSQNLPIAEKELIPIILVGVT